MDGLTSAQRQPSMRFGPDRRITVAAAVGAVLALGTGIAADDAPGRLLFGLAALLLAAYAISDLYFAPRLAVDASGLQVRSPLARADVPWDEVDEVRADTRARYGLRSVTLEIDAGETLIVLSRRALGAPPEVVAETVRAFDPRPSR